MEEVIVSRILAKIIDMNEPPPIFAVIGRTSLPGWIIIETERIESVAAACHGISSIFLQSVHSITRDEAPRYFKEPPSFSPTEGGWVRLKQKPYRDDLAYVYSVDKRTLSFEAWVVPRMDVTMSDKKRMKSKSSFRPEKRLFDKDIAAQYHGQDSISVRNRVVVFNNEYVFIEGLLVLTNPSYFPQEPVPTREEVLWFQGCSYVNRTSIQQGLLKADYSDVNIGDTVRIVQGGSQGMCGVVIMVRTDDADVQFSSQGLTESVPLSCLRKLLKIGDEAIVTDGMESGFSGWVVGLHNGDVFIYSHTENREVTSYYFVLKCNN